MKFTKNPIVKLVTVSAVVASCFSTNALAQAQPAAAVVCEGYKQGPSSVPGQRVGKKIGKAFELYSADQVEEAIATLKEIETSQKFDRAYTDRFIGNLLAGQEGKAKEALGYLESSVKEKVLGDTDHASTLKLVAALSLQEEKYQQAVDKYQEWLTFTCKKDAEVHFRIANAYFQMGRFNDAIPSADTAIALYDKPSKNPYLIKLQSYSEQKKYREALAVAEDMVRLFPEEGQYWGIMGMYYLMLEDNKKALSAMELAYQQGFLDKENQIKALAQLYSVNDIPYKSATLQEKHLKDGLLKKDEKRLVAIANAWQQSREYVKAASYFGQAAVMSNDPEHFRKQGILLSVAERYTQAIAAFNKALELDDGSKKSSLHEELMMANFYKGNFKVAYTHAKEMAKDKRKAKTARGWFSYIEEKAKNRGIRL